MPHRKKRSVKESPPPKRKAANRRKAKKDPISEMYANAEQGWPATRTKQPRKASGGKRQASGPAHASRGKKTAAAKRTIQRAATA